MIMNREVSEMCAIVSIARIVNSGQTNTDLSLVVSYTSDAFEFNKLSSVSFKFENSFIDNLS